MPTALFTNQYGLKEFIKKITEVIKKKYSIIPNEP